MSYLEQLERQRDALDKVIGKYRRQIYVRNSFIEILALQQPDLMLLMSALYSRGYGFTTVDDEVTWDLEYRLKGGRGYNICREDGKYTVEYGTWVTSWGEEYFDEAMEVSFDTVAEVIEFMDKTTDEYVI